MRETAKLGRKLPSESLTRLDDSFKDGIITFARLPAGQGQALPLQFI